jgi:DNA-binding response OmpR family regulator
VADEFDQRRPDATAHSGDADSVVMRERQMSQVARSTRRKVLIIDDQAVFVDALRRQFSRSGLQCISKGAAWDLFTRVDLASFALVLLVVRQSASERFQFCQLLPAARSFPLLACLDVAANIEKAFELGADDCILAPVDADELLARTRSLLTRGTVRAPAPQTLTYGDLHIDCSMYVATWKGQQLALPNAEFELLQALAKAQGRPQTREILMKTVLGGNALTARIIDVHVSKLRRAMGPSARKCIRAIRGLGYALDVEALTSDSKSAVAAPVAVATRRMRHD